MPMILDETIHILKNRYKDQVKNLFISDVRIGLYMTAIRLSDGSMGLSSTAKPVNPEIHRKKENRDYGDFTPNNITGKKVTDLLGSSKEGPLVDTLRVAVISEKCRDHLRHKNNRPGINTQNSKRGCCRIPYVSVLC